MAEEAPQARMSLSEHLGELRKRLLRCVVAVLVLGAAGLVFARPIFAFLMRPVLDALPPTDRSLIYTSGIEELNVLMKVGLYAGIFLATPVILAQIWGFVAPGLYPRERRYASPFILLGTLAFLLGAAFCYLVLLPTMFRFLLNSGETAPIKARIEHARAIEEEALRFARLDDFQRAANLADLEVTRLTSSGEGKVASPERTADGAVELQTRLELQASLLDAARAGLGPAADPALRQALEKRVEAVEAYQSGALSHASEALEQSSALLAGAAGARGSELNRLWTLQKALAAGQAALSQEAWTKPLLTMSEQLSLVLMLLLALGVVFELPLVIALLSALGLVQSRWLMKYQRHAFVVCLILAAVITPTGDPINMSVLAGPMLLCYEVGVLAAWLIERRRARDASQTALTPT
jgi:sec-independent protein translocase protein TatC